MQGVDLASLTWVDAALVAMSVVERTHKTPMDQDREWRRLATLYGIPIEADPQLESQRRQAVGAQLEALFGPIQSGTVGEEDPEGPNDEVDDHE